MPEPLFAPLWKDRDGNELFILGSDYCANNHDDAHRIAMGMMLVEGVLLGLKFVEVREVDQKNLPHTKARLDGCTVAVVGGPTFDAAFPPEVIAKAREEANA